MPDPVLFLAFDQLTQTISNLLLFFALPWVVFSLLSTITDVSVGYIDELLLSKLGSNKSKIDIDAPGQLILISGLFGLVVSAIVFLLIITTEKFNFEINFEIFANAFGAGILEVLWLIPYFYAIEKGGALRSTPIFQTIPIFSLIFGLLIFGEIPIMIHIIATIFILAGAFLLNYSPAVKSIDFKTLSLMLVSSSIISIGYFLFKDAAELGNFVTAIFLNGLGMGAFSITIWIAWRPYREQFIKRIKTFDKKILFLQTANEGLYASSAVFNQLAIVMGPSVMVVSALNAFHPVFTLSIGGLLAKLGYKRYQEDLAGTGKILKLVAIVAIALGTIMIAN